MLSSFAVSRTALLKNSNGTVDTCDALFQEENIEILGCASIRSCAQAITEKTLGIRLESTSLQFSYHQSQN